ncbi:hypothetical protein GCM10011529_19630 [Polymorphobacter glacialis]|uniref:Twin-arginine translocation pathway signal protein n=1 Tax=Sandarakinorhabdus glacialis TaxID=1614636 RepID=A0A916ZVD4_9SPHN|nr:hypothetical protein [Polymorphobacter glacialis]GGE13347.1 hypothetical protein GCM10011529_19630 [Polymorphobacter glacialis]
MINRRTALRIGGGTGAVLAAATLPRAIDQGLIFDRAQPGLKAWDDWNSRRYDGALSLVSAGILAASPHNTQPWIFGVSRYGVDIFEVPGRNLGAMDPFGRERLAGLGAAIHNMGLASTAIDPGAVVRLLPDPGDPGHVARIELGPEGGTPRPHPLLPMIGRRHTDRGAYQGGPTTAAQQIALRSAAGTPLLRIALIDPASPAGKRFAELTIASTQAIAADTEMMAASHAWFRHSRRDRDRYKDGLGIPTAGLSPFTATMGAILLDSSPATEGRYWIEATRETALPTASLFGLIVAGDPHDRRTAILAGAAWQRLHLTAIALGLAAQPLNQLPEMIDRDRQLGRPPRFATAANAILEDPLWRPTFAFRIGHPATPALPSPRRPVSQVIGQSAREDFEIERSRTETSAQDAAMARKLKAGQQP